MQSLGGAIFGFGEGDGPEGPPEIFAEGGRVVVGACVGELGEVGGVERAGEGVEDLGRFDVAVGVDVLPGDHVGVAGADHLGEEVGD